MGCYFCGGGDMWIKTCRTLDGPRIRVCDPCYEIRASELVVVPGDWVVAARCDLCWSYGKPRDFEVANPGGRKGVFSGICPGCMQRSVDH